MVGTWYELQQMSETLYYSVSQPVGSPSTDRRKENNLIISLYFVNFFYIAYNPIFFHISVHLLSIP